jgi:hypothetical protein
MALCAASSTAAQIEPDIGAPRAATNATSLLEPSARAGDES